MTGNSLGEDSNAINKALRVITICDEESEEGKWDIGTGPLLQRSIGHQLAMISNITITHPLKDPFLSIANILQVCRRIKGPDTT